MPGLRAAVGLIWLAFWIYWIGSAFGAKRSHGRLRRLPLTGLSTLTVFVVVRVIRGTGEIHSVAVGVIGLIVFLCGLALCVWARINLGSNWGMPMTEKDDPELVTSGPYRLIRHPIYTGLVLGLLGTTLVNNVLGLIAVAVLFGYFAIAARVEERNLTTSFPEGYPEYRARTKMMIPFVF